MQAFTKADVHRLDHKRLYIHKQLGKESAVFQDFACILQENWDYDCWFQKGGWQEKPGSWLVYTAWHRDRHRNQ